MNEIWGLVSGSLMCGLAFKSCKTYPQNTRLWAPNSFLYMDNYWNALGQMLRSLFISTSSMSKNAGFGPEIVFHHLQSSFGLISAWPTYLILIPNSLSLWPIYQASCVSERTFLPRLRTVHWLFTHFCSAARSVVLMFCHPQGAKQHASL